tara:strand:- start:133 stop:387 length:255 start_codon:yes stop_codon:yes gene_type:complete
MFERRFRLERQEFGQWWFLGSFCDIYSAISLMKFHDPEGTIAMRIWDIERDKEVPPMEVALAMSFLQRKRRQHDRRLDWRECGF